MRPRGNGHVRGVCPALGRGGLSAACARILDRPTADQATGPRVLWWRAMPAMPDGGRRCRW